MKLSTRAIELIDNTTVRIAIAKELKVGEQAVCKAIKSNRDNGTLTKATALIIIRHYTGLTNDEILIEAMDDVSA